THYCKIVGELLYLTVCTCADISFVVNTLAQNCVKPSPCYYTAAKHLLHYLSRTLNL
ncbi:hypothetical protein BDR06DRAFT_827934, partial [Suillus hirtellus]